MSYPLHSIIVVDIEATCWAGYPPVGMTNEIIEVGICEVNTKILKINKSHGYDIRPEVSTISEFCTELTGFTQERADRGLEYQEAMFRIAKEFNTRKRIWCSWGEYDRKMFLNRRQCYPFSDQHINLKNWFRLMFNKESGAGVQQALEILGMKFEGRQHSGLDDAINIGRILCRMIHMIRQQ